MNALHLLEEGLEILLETVVPLVVSLAEIVGLAIILFSLFRASYHYIRDTFFHDDYDFHHEMTSGLTTALEFLLAAEVSRTIILPTFTSVLLLAGTFGLRALMSLLLHAEMRTARAEKAEARREAKRAEMRTARAEKAEED